MLAIAGGKGGCGKTTTALGLARALARAGQSPLVVDADCDMPDAHHVAGIERNDGTDRVATGASLTSVVQEPDAFPGVALLTAGTRDHLPAALARARTWRGPVIVDCPAGISPDATRPLRIAEWALLVTTDEPQCLEDTEDTGIACRQLGAEPVGALLWESRGGDVGVIGEVPVVARVPTVNGVFADATVARSWKHLAAHISDNTARIGRVRA